MRFFVFCVLINSFLWSIPEIIVERDDVPFMIGQSAIYSNNGDIFQWEPFDTLDQWWDLTAYPYTRSARIHLLHPSSGVSPAPETFALAKIVELDTMGSGDIVWTYLSDTTFFLHVLGIDYETGGFRFLGNYRPDYNCYVYPIYDGAGWNTAWTWTYEVYPGLPYTANETHQKVIVAKGKVKVPFSGNHFWPCLVIRDYMTYSDNFGTWDTRWIYEWVVPGRFGGANGVAAAQSTNGAGQSFMLVDNMFAQYTLTVPGWDLRCPDFSNTTIWPDTGFNGPFVVSSIITDSTGIGADSLFYKINSGPFMGVTHDSIIGDDYYFTIPQVAQACTIGYLLWAADSFSVANDVGIWNTDPICAPESTYFKFYCPTGITEVKTEKIQTGLRAAPNPTIAGCNFTYTITNNRRSHHPQIIIYDISGRVVRHIELPRSNNTGSGNVHWDGLSDVDKIVPAGIYFACLSIDQERFIVPITIIR
ncbi:hypothetical protein A2Y85_07985 [candidate division WOR-3 bacterium RBG_13_43_14]|uniref:FlgD Ig-like domain-containing protein n=1 Tax=candidate division WOR-3 bacterium RBG_13_43_14 TaxID=1802590 RepID=A0A1F4U1N0_UNCW3|nr:MAG: hypothetical protein A2Y85_07985 [candidate division WOR-3 bacterium RBG_13_43_14]